MSVNPFDIKNGDPAKHAQHVVLVHFPVSGPDPGERPDTWVTVCTGHMGDTPSPRGGSDALEGVFGYG